MHQKKLNEPRAIELTRIKLNNKEKISRQDEKIKIQRVHLNDNLQ